MKRWDTLQSTGFNLRCLDGWTLGVDPSLKLTDFESPLQGGNLESGGSRLGRPYTKKWGKYKMPYPRFHRFCYKTVLQISHNHLLFSHIILSNSDGGGGPRSVTYFWGVQDLWQFVTGGGGSKIIKNCVTYFMDGPKCVSPQSWNLIAWIQCNYFKNKLFCVCIPHLFDFSFPNLALSQYYISFRVYYKHCVIVLFLMWTWIKTKLEIRNWRVEKLLRLMNENLMN